MSSTTQSHRNVVALIRSLKVEFAAIAHEQIEHRHQQQTPTTALTSATSTPTTTTASGKKSQFDTVNQVLDKFCFADDEWLSLSVFQEQQYSRMLLYSNEHFSVMLMCWLPGQATPIHSHNADEMCWMRVISGTLTHHLYAGDSEQTYAEVMCVRLTGASGISRHKGQAPHAVANRSEAARAVSLHVYSPTYLECCFFSNGMRRRIPFVYRALDGVADDDDDVCSVPSSPSSASDEHGQQTPIYASLDELVATLRAELQLEDASQRSAATVARVRALLEQFRFNAEEWQQYASFTSGAYTRNLIGYDEKFTMLLLCWPANLASPVHDHAGSSCWMKILAGHMRETRYENDRSMRVKSVLELGPEEAAYIDDSRGLHKMGNASAIAPSVSLHIYSPPIARCRVFDELSGDAREVSLRGANACANPFMESDLGALAAPLGESFRVPPSSPELPPANVAELCARLRAVFAAAVPKAVRNEQLCYLLNEARFAKHEWDEYVHFSERRYQRVLLAFDENFSLVLNCWNKAQTTPLHRHHGRDAWYRVVAGELTVQRFAADGVEQLDARPLAPAHGATYLSSIALGVHRVANASAERGAVSLHLYNPPLVSLRAHCSHTAPPLGAIDDTMMPPPSPDDVPVVYCAKALQPRAADSQLARAHSATAVFGNFQSFVSAIRHCLRLGDDAARNDGITRLISEYHFRPDEWMSYMNDDLAARTLIGIGHNFTVVMRFWPAGYASAPHTHGDALCWVKVLHGAIENVVYHRDAATGALVQRTVKRYVTGHACLAMDETTIHAMRCVTAAASDRAAPPPVPDSPSVLPAAVTLHVFVGMHADAVAFSADGSEKRVDIGEMFRLHPSDKVE
jgi:cysteine dioxygenase